MNRSEVLHTIHEVGVIPAVHVPSVELGARAVAAVLAGGVSVFEVAITEPGALDLIRDLSKRFGGRAIVGASNVIRPEDALASIDAGSAFILTPGLDVETVTACRSRGVAIIAGALTPTEVMAASKAGADMVRLFPVFAVGGSRYVKALKAVLPELRLVPTGGVSLANLHEYIGAGAAAVGIETELVDVTVFESHQDDTLTDRSASFVRAVQAGRSES